MKIIISPAKSLDFDSQSPTQQFTNAQLLTYATTLNDVLKQLTPKNLSDLMKISDSLGQLNYNRNQNWSLPFTATNAKQAVYAFTGDVYKGLDALSIHSEKIPVLQHKLRILSGLYGILKPLDLIQPYRLEMGTKLVTSNAKNLYEFWGDILVDNLNAEMTEDDLLVDLASKEYSKAIPKKKLKAKLITPVFKELKGDTYKIVAIYAKRARGLMARFIIDSDAKTIDDLKNFNTDGYGFSEQLSTSSELVFTR